MKLCIVCKLNFKCTHSKQKSNVWIDEYPEYHDRLNIPIYRNIPINSGWFMSEICNHSGIRGQSIGRTTTIEGEAPAAGIAQWFVSRLDRFQIGTVCEVCFETNFVSPISFVNRFSKLTMDPDQTDHGS